MYEDLFSFVTSDLNKVKNDDATIYNNDERHDVSQTSFIILTNHEETLKPSSLPSKQRLVSLYS